MARYRLNAAIIGQPDNAPYQKLAAGRTVANSVANAIGADVVWSALCAAPNATMIPLDGAAQTIMQAAFPNNPLNIVTVVGGAAPSITGGDSIS
jgi:hypothetical protein